MPQEPIIQARKVQLRAGKQLPPTELPFRQNPKAEKAERLTDLPRETLQILPLKRVKPYMSATGKRSGRTIFLQFVLPGQTSVFGNRSMLPFSA